MDELCATTQVEGQGEVYLVYPSNLCTCMSFFFDVVTKHESHTCKHLLAVQLADALGSCTTVVMPDDHLAELLADA